MPQLKTLTREHAAKLINYALNDRSRTTHAYLRRRDALLILLQLDAGLRIGEACQVQCMQLHVAGRTNTTLDLQPMQTKTREPRSVPLTLRLTQVVAEAAANDWSAYTEYARSYALNVNTPLAALPVRTAQDIIHRLSTKALGFRINPHMLRHTFATRLRQTTDLRVVQDLLGHKSVRSTQIYTHVDSTDRQKAIEALNGDQDNAQHVR